jgi:mannitol-1-/sugar-/sorbitol-6-/2-deoxyglucose-6-phosphatase
MIKAAIFDMDGLLIDSEPIWQKSEIEIFGQVDVTLTREMCMQTMGLRLDEVVKHWHEIYPWSGKSLKEIEEAVIDTVVSHIQKEGQALPGVYKTLEILKSMDIILGLASSSSFRIINTIVDKLKIREYFSVIHSAEVEPYGKPHPAIYISAAELIDVPVTKCVALEDSFNGLIAAKAARMKTIAVPEGSCYEQTRFDIADIKLRSLEEFNAEMILNL